MNDGSNGQDRTVEIEVPVQAIYMDGPGAELIESSAAAKFVWLRVNAG